MPVAEAAAAATLPKTVDSIAPRPQQRAATGRDGFTWCFWVALHAMFASYMRVSSILRSRHTLGISTVQRAVATCLGGVCCCLATNAVTPTVWGQAHTWAQAGVE